MTINVVHSLERKHVEELHSLFQKEWWTCGREFEDVERMLENSDCLFAFIDSNENCLVAFARVLSDFVYKALILDVIVDSHYRGKKLGAQIMEEILHDPRIVHVKHKELYCLPEMIPFYQKWEFRGEGTVVFMRKADKK